MPVYLTPGVYKTPQATPAPLFTLVRTDIAGFVGYAERGPLPEDFPGRPVDAVTKLTSWREFQAQFGNCIASGYLAYAVQAFFQNGGDTCYVARAAATTSSDPAQRPARASYAFATEPALAVGKLTLIGSGNLVSIDSGATPIQAGSLIQIVAAGLTTSTMVTDSLGAGLYLLAARLPAVHAAGNPVLLSPSSFFIIARSAGNWGNNIQADITPLDGGAFGLRLTVNRGPLLVPTEYEFYKRLTLTNPSAADFAPTVLQNTSQLADIALPSGPAVLIGTPASTITINLQGGRDGLAAITVRDVLGSEDDLRGLRLLEDVEEIANIAIPDASYTGVPDLQPVPPTPPICSDSAPLATGSRTLPADPTSMATPFSAADSLSIKQAMIDHCVRLRYRVAIVDPPSALHPEEMQSWPLANGLRSRSGRYAALYYPWIRVADPLNPLQQGGLRTVPPSGHVAGIYAKNDLTFGVFRAPANFALEFASLLAESISDEQQEGLNPSRVNAIRALPGRGIRVWGARSLSDEDGDWTFIHVRRLMSAIEKTVEICSRWIVFENNTYALRSAITHSLTVLLTSFWTAGGLMGKRPQEGFYVKCDATNNPASVIDVGMLICEIGVAVAAPMEFLVFEIRRDLGAMEVAET